MPITIHLPRILLVSGDVRTGGLKRDLSSAFANEEDWADLESVAENWSDDFSNYIYKHRVFYQKSVPMEKNARKTIGVW